MKKLLLIAIVCYGTSCTNPEDRATGNKDSSRFNSNEKKVLNSRPGPTDPKSQSDGEKADTSGSPSTSSKNTHSATNGTNRGYKAGGDSAKH